MHYLYHPEAGHAHLHLSDEAYRYVAKVRRRRVGEMLNVRHLRDDTRYRYRIAAINRRDMTLELIDSTPDPVIAERSLRLGWCVIDPRVLERHLPLLNTLGVEAITFIMCARSQRRFAPDLARLERILIASSQQCGRSRLMHLDTAASLAAFLSSRPDAWMLDFGAAPLATLATPPETILIGCEGGWDEDERALISKARRLGLATPMTLRSEGAAVAVAAHILV